MRADERTDASRARSAREPRGAPRRIILLASLTLAAASCGPRPHSPPDASPLPEPDAAVLMVDTDGDGLCDTTEFARGTDPALLDTDGDGFSDLVELQVGSDPRSRATPDRELLVFLPTDRGFVASTLLTYGVRGEGGNYVGGFSARRRPYGGEASANDFFDRAFAVSARPLAQVGAIEGERFIHVVGRTLLSYQVDLAYRDRDGLVECMELFPFVYQVKLEGVGLVGYQQRLLVVGPRAMSPGRGAWCVPASCF